MAQIRAGFLGAGYIAKWHAEVLAGRSDARLVAVADPALSAAEALAGVHGAAAYASLEAMLAEAQLDTLHVLTPPHLHRAHAETALAAGVHVYTEKPCALSSSDCAAMISAALTAGRVISVNHNFLGQPGWTRLRAALADGRLGKIDMAEIRWLFPLPPIRSGPFGLWMLRKPENLLLELGPHLFAFATALFGPLEDLHVRTGKEIDLPNGGRLPQTFDILARAAGDVAVTLTLSLVEGAEDRSVHLRGVSGIARYDYGNDVLVIERPNASDIVINPLRRELSLAGQHLREGVVNALRQGLSLNRRQPYALGFHATMDAFYDAVTGTRPLPEDFSAETAGRVIAGVEAAIAALPTTPAADVRPPPPAPAPDAPVALVIGGTGFIGRALVAALVADGQAVRVLSRSAQNPFPALGAAVTMVTASMQDEAALADAMAGVQTVYHLAKAEEKTWEGYLRNDVEVAERVARAALSAGVRRFVYTGTIASYDASRPERTITEDIDFGTEDEMERRNLYARSKALCEARLEAMARDRGLPLVIARPGIVLGAGGPLQHWGIGRWHGAGAVRIWGSGRNILPFVLVEDVADALVRIGHVNGIEGQSFNLVGPPMLSARDYFDAIHRLTGTRIRAQPGNLTMFWMGDMVKYGLKRFVLRRKGLTQPSLADWKARAHLSPFDHRRAVEVLGWQPETDQDRFILRAIGDKSFFGF